MVGTTHTAKAAQAAFFVGAQQIVFCGAHQAAATMRGCSDPKSDRAGPFRRQKRQT